MSLAVAVGPGLAAPTPQGGRGTPSETAAPASEFVSPAGDAHGDERTGAPSHSETRRSGGGAEVATTAPPVTRATLPRRSASAVLVEEDPRVEAADVADAVAGATLSAVPWLHLGARPRGDAPRRGEAAQADAELSLRLEADAANRAGGGLGRAGDGHRGTPEINLLNEAVEMARDVVANPLTWIVGIPLLLGAFIVTVLRGRGK